MVRSSVDVPAVRPTAANPLEPARVEVGGRLHMEARAGPAAGTVPRAGGYCSSLAPDHDDRVDRIEHPLQRPLMFLGRQADRVDEPDLSLRVQLHDSPPDLGHVVLGRRRLANDAQLLVGKPTDVGLGFEDVEADPGPRRSPGPPHAPCGRSRARDSPEPGATGPPGGPERPGDRSRRSRSLPDETSRRRSRSLMPWAVTRTARSARELRARSSDQPRFASRTREPSGRQAPPRCERAGRGSHPPGIADPLDHLEGVPYAEAHSQHVRPDHTHNSLLLAQVRADPVASSEFSSPGKLLGNTKSKAAQTS